MTLTDPFAVLAGRYQPTESEWDEAVAAWHSKARPEQLTPAEAELGWFLCGGRGGGKTRSGAEDISEFCAKTRAARVALVGPTFADVRDTMVEGESGLLRVLPPSALRGGSIEKAWNRSIGELFLANGCQLRVFSSEKPGRLRGPQHHRAWGDEPAEWEDAKYGDALDTTWSNLLLGLRLDPGKGLRPQVVLTGTPKPNKLVKHLLALPSLTVRRTTTYDNLGNLAHSFRAQVLDAYEGTRLGRQELMAELLEDVEGSLWQREWIDEYRVKDAPDLVRIVVAVDPSGSSDGAEVGIVVAGQGRDGHGYVLADYSTKATPDAWGRRVVAAFHDWRADRVVAERNFGGEMVRFTIQAAASAIGRGEIPYRDVNASHGKTVRAEPIAALYEQGRVHHVGELGLLEDQQCSWVPLKSPSPDRLDAVVWALTELKIGGGPGAVAEPIEVGRSPAGSSAWEPDGYGTSDSLAVWG